MKILLVDDEQVILEELVEDLTHEGHSVVVAHDGQQAYQIFQEKPHTFDLVLTDVKMPSMDGLALLELLHVEDPDLPIVVITGHGHLDVAIKAMQHGAIDFIEKPFRLKKLYDTLGRVQSLYLSKREFAEILPFVQPIELVIPSDTRWISGVIAYLHAQYYPLCQQFNLNSSKIRLCLIEAITNAIIHGNLQIETRIKEQSWDLFNQLVAEREASPEYGNKKVIIRYQLVQGRYEFEVEDEGKGFDYSHLPNFEDPMSLLNVSGRGLLFIHNFMDEVSWNAKGTCLKMVKYLKPAP